MYPSAILQKFYGLGLLVLIVCSICSINAAEKQYVGIFYVAKGGESLDSILDMLNIPKKISYGNANYAQRIKNLNKTITNWDQLSRGSNIYLKVPKSFYDKNPPKTLKTLSVETQVKEKIEGTVDYVVAYDESIKTAEVINRQKAEGYRVKNEEELKTESNSEKIKHEKNSDTKKTDEQNHLSVFYIASIGSFSETIPNSNLTVSSNQNSPFSIGLAFTSKYKKIEHVLSASFYISKLSATTDGTQTITPPLEYGFNIYDQIPILKQAFFFYGGLDFEKFSTINTEELANGSEGKSFGQSIFYITGGIATNFQIRSGFSAKVALSQSIFSSGTSTTITEKKKYTGQRIIFFGGYELTPNIALNVLYKKHFLSGPTELSIDRIGFGFSYRFF